MTPLLTLWPSAATRIVSVKAGVLVKSAPTMADMFDSIDSNELSSTALADKIIEIHRKRIKLEMSDTTLHIVAVVPLFDEDFTAGLEKITGACGASRHKLSLHVIALRNDIARCLDATLPASPEKTETANIRTLDKASTDGEFRFSYSVIDDYAANGAPLDFTAASLSGYLALIFSSLMRAYHTVLPPALLSGGSNRVIALGAGAISFDRDGASQYLLHRAFVAALQDAGVDRETVDAGLASDRAQKILRSVTDRFRKFYNDSVLPPLRDDHKDEASLVADIAPLLDDEFKDIEKSLTGFLSDPSLTFPQREAVLSLMLGRDNSRLKGIQYDTETLLLDDICSEPFDIYINAYNAGEKDSLIPVRGDFEKLKKFITDPDTGELTESKDKELAFNPLEEIKRLKKEILNTTAFIRRKTDELRQLAEADEKRRMAENRITDKDDDKEKEERLLTEIKEQPLDEVYKPDPGTTPKRAVDLRSFFSPVRDQGRLGSCSTFATVSMYEALMNRYSDSGAPLANMSEFYVYYHSNILNGKPEGGSNYFEQLAVLGQKGTCDESLFGYTTTELDKEPSQAAIDDAARHRVLKALQIPLRNTADKAECMRENHRLLTSALSEGYPVGIALKIFDNFSRKGAYINRPDDEDIASGGEGGHAMVLAGYSEADKCYIVRNSWGTGFGDKGYAYISAAYIDDPDYNSFACIIASTTDSEGGHAAEIPGTIAPFGGTETEIRMAAIRNAIDEEKIILASLEELYEENYKYYQMLTQRLCIPQVRTEIRRRAETALAERYVSVRGMRTELLNNFTAAMSQFKREYIKRALIVSLIALVTMALCGAMIAYDFSRKPILYTAGIAAVATAAAVFTWLNYVWYKRRKRREYQENLDDLKVREEKIARELIETQLRFHVAGMWIDRFHQLSLDLGKTYDRLMSFNDNLNGWYKEDSSAAATPVDRSSKMLIYLNDTELLDRYFEANISQITGRIDLMQTFGNYAVDRETIQAARERLRTMTLDAIRPLFEDFRIADFLMGRAYPYLHPVKLEEEINRLLAVGQPSLRFSDSNADSPVRIQLIGIEEKRIAAWQNVSDPCYPFHPMVISTDNPCSLDQLTVQPLSPDAMR